MTMRRHGEVVLADTARVLGEVSLGPGVNLWPGASVRGDVAAVTIGPGSNVQDNASVHCDAGKPNAIGADVSIGHNAIVHGREVGDGTLIGMGAIVMGETRIGRGCLVAAGALVPPGTVVPDGHAVIGLPGRIARVVTAEEAEYLRWLAPHYVKLAAGHADRPDDPRFRPWQPG